MSSSFSRKILFWILAALFLITAIIIIIYSFGYRFNRQRGIFIYTGSVTIKSIPRKIKINIDKHPVPSRKINFLNYSYHIDGLHPGEHFLLISSKNHQSWKKNIIIHSGISTEFWNVFLAKNNYIENFYPSPYPLKNFFISPANDKIALVENKSQNLFIKLLEIKGKLATEFSTKQIFFSTLYAFPSQDPENIEWSPDNKQLIIPLISHTKHTPYYFIFNLKDNQLLDLTQKLNENHFSFTNNIQQARWDGKRKNKIFFLANKKLYYLDLNSLQKDNNCQPSLLLNHVAAYDISDGDIYFISDNDNLIYHISNNNYNQPQAINQKSFPFTASDKLKLVVYDKTRIFIINQNKQDLYIYNQGKKDDYQKLLSNGVIDAQFSDDGKKLLFWNNNEIFVYFTRDWETQPIRSENEVQSLTRFSQKIYNVQWYKDYEHVIFGVGKEIKIIELDQRGYRNLQTLFTLTEVPSKITGNSFEERLYFSQPHNNVLNLSFISLKEE